MTSKTSYHYHPFELRHDLDEMIPGNPIDKIHGSNADCADWPGEIDGYNAEIRRMIERGEIDA